MPLLNSREHVLHSFLRVDFFFLLVKKRILFEGDGLGSAFNGER